MNKMINRLLLTGGKFMPELYLKQPGFTYSACGPFSKHREIIQKFRETGNLKYLYINESDKACSTHDAHILRVKIIIIILLILLMLILHWLKKLRPILKFLNLKWMIAWELLSIRIFLV